MSSEKIITTLGGNKNQKFNYKTARWRAQNASVRTIEMEIYCQIVQHCEDDLRREGIYGEVHYHNPNTTDGVIDIYTLEKAQRILIGVKQTTDFTREEELLPALAQVLHYCHQFHRQGDMVPAAIVLASAVSMAIVPTDPLQPLWEDETLWKGKNPSDLNTEAVDELRGSELPHRAMPLNQNFSVGAFMASLSATLQSSTQRWVMGT